MKKYGIACAIAALLCAQLANAASASTYLNDSLGASIAKRQLALNVEMAKVAQQKSDLAELSKRLSESDHQRARATVIALPAALIGTWFLVVGTRMALKPAHGDGMVMVNLFEKAFGGVLATSGLAAVGVPAYKMYVKASRAEELKKAVLMARIAVLRAEKRLAVEQAELDSLKNYVDDDR